MAVGIELDGRKAMVTGAAHGFGRAIARVLAAAGAIVWCGDILEDELEETRRLIGERCHKQRLDVTDCESVKYFVEEAARAHGGVDILINNAGGVLGQTHQSLENVDPAAWQALFDVNATGAFYCAQAVAPRMKAAHYGRIINISSGAGLRTSLTGIQGYAAAKAAQIGLTRQLARELGPWRVTVNNIAPGFVRSNPATERQWQAYGPQGQTRLIDSLFLKRPGAAEDIAHAVLFFASDLAGWITGQVLSVDGGT